MVVYFDVVCIMENEPVGDWSVDQVLGTWLTDRLTDRLTYHSGFDLVGFDVWATGGRGLDLDHHPTKLGG